MEVENQARLRERDGNGEVLKTERESVSVDGRESWWNWKGNHRVGEREREREVVFLESVDTCAWERKEEREREG